jgi:gentisate 1,2-dioxygenase
MDDMRAATRVYEYSQAAAVELPTQPHAAFPASLHEAPGASREIPLDLSAALNTPYAATSPNLLATFIALNAGESVATAARATAAAFFVLRGAGTTRSAAHGEVAWAEGDLFVLPLPGALVHAAAADCGARGAALYTICDEPLLRYLGAEAREARSGAAFYSRAALLGAVAAVRAEPGAGSRNRMGVLLSGAGLEETKTLSRTLWALLNVLPPHTKQPPHRHNSVAVDLCVSVGAGAEGLVYTLMGPELDEAGYVKDPVKMDWASGAVFTTPPGWWHSHHNESGEDAWVLPTQDAGLFTHQRTLDIRFSHAPALPAGSGGK